MDMNLPVIAGTVSTLIFAFGTLPMLAKAFRSKDLKSYSLSTILLNNGGNAIHSIYVFSLPPGPIWLLHSFNLITTALMLAWYVRYELIPDRSTTEAFGGREHVADLSGLNIPH